MEANDGFSDERRVEVNKLSSGKNGTRTKRKHGPIDEHDTKQTINDPGPPPNSAQPAASELNRATPPPPASSGSTPLGDPE